MSPLDRLVEVAGWYVGVRETGPNAGTNVEEFQKAVDGKAQGESWCCCFVMFCVQTVCKELGITQSIFSTEHCMTAWNKSPKRYLPASAEVKPGFIVIWKHEGTTNGHTGIVTAVDGDNIHTIEGNTSDGTAVNPDGDGVYARIRNRYKSGNMVVQGFIDPLN